MLNNSFVSRFYMSLKVGLADWKTQADGVWKILRPTRRRGGGGKREGVTVHWKKDAYTVSWFVVKTKHYLGKQNKQDRMGGLKMLILFLLYALKTLYIQFPHKTLTSNWLILHTWLNSMSAFVFNSFSFVFLQIHEIFACCASMY